MLAEQLDAYTSRSAEEERRTNNAENAEWGPIAAQSMMDKTRDFPIHFGDGKRTLGDMYDRTPKDLISKVSLEEKIFETWFGGRIVLLGDGMSFLLMLRAEGNNARWKSVALVLTLCTCISTCLACHKLNPAGGQGIRRLLLFF